MLALVPLKSTALDPAAFGHPIRVACVGDSITQGVGTQHPEEDSYPARLQTLLGKDWVVHNFGVGGRTLLRKADPFDYGGALQFAPDVVIIALGTNDSKTAIWGAHQGEFTDDYVAMIRAFQALPNHPQVWACLPPPAFPGNWGITEDVLRDGVLPGVKKAAQITGIPWIDLHAPLLGNHSWFPDTVHPNEAGAKRIAELVAAELTKR
ncbi:MAG: GDSL-type esterase/lipase family protein [Chthoniobacter sp.]|uniref:GDSL-type esterase/lipase family protein n=1 Tax=Chthoniobacter sp. TaxID=2510640 RepID=UPI0032A863E2